MALKHVWGFGGVYLAAGSYTATFTYATGRMTFDPIYKTYNTLNQTIYPIFMGYRVKLEIEAHNVCDTDYTSFVDLVNVLNAATSYAYDLYVTPYYSTTDDNLSYRCHCVSPVNFEQIARVKVGQRISLVFESAEAVFTLPTLTSDPTSYYWVNDGSDNIVDHDGNKLIFSA